MLHFFVTLILHQMLAEVLGHGHGLWVAEGRPRSSRYLYLLYSVFGCFMLGFFYNVSAEYFPTK